MTKTFPELILKDIQVLCVVASNGVKNSVEAFRQLESKLPTLKQRHFYGTLTGSPDNGTYRACVKIVKTDNPKSIGLETWVIPGGKYIKTKIKNWESNVSLIGPTFGKMADQQQNDDTRPMIEYYRSQKELILYSPIKDVPKP
jgi:DNA gyrase inhibitor GyrI